MGDKIFGIIFQDSEGKFSLWTELELTESEAEVIMEILKNHDTDGGSISGCNTLKELLEEV